MSGIASFVATVQARAEKNALIEAGEIGRCAECDFLTADKDEDGDWCCADCLTDRHADDAYNSPTHGQAAAINGGGKS